MEHPASPAADRGGGAISPPAQCEGCGCLPEDPSGLRYEPRFGRTLCETCVSSIETMVAEIATEGTAHLRRLDVGRMVREQPPPVPYVVEGLAVEGCVTMVTGREGEGKSLLAQAIAAGVALGEQLAGLECRKGCALIVDAENGEQPTLIVLDSYRSLWPGGDENDPAKVAAALDPLRNRIRRSGAAAILLHHLPKNARSNYRGTTAIGAAVELGFKLSRGDGDPESADRRRLDCFKCRVAPEPARRWLRLHAERGRVFVDRADPYEADGEPERPRPARAELAPEMLAAAN